MTRQRLQTIFILIVLLFTCWTTAIFGKGCSGTYYISGTAYATDKSVLKNATLTVKFGKDNKTVATDSNGHFEIELLWTSACPSGLTVEQHKEENKKINPEYIYISYAGSKMKLKNEWQKYGQCFPKSKDAVTWKKNLYFSNG